MQMRPLNTEIAGGSKQQLEALCYAFDCDEGQVIENALQVLTMAMFGDFPTPFTFPDDARIRFKEFQKPRN
jgi:hypothetical protein